MKTCTNCGSHNLQWHCGTENVGGAVNGRLEIHDVKPIFYLACEDCSETLEHMSGDKVAEILKESQFNC